MSESKLVKRQYKHHPDRRPIKGYGGGAAITATIRFDDECGNGHNTFSITGSVWVPRYREPQACGCLHDEIAKAFPEWAHLIKWHLCSTSGPLHYVPNTAYLAGDRDCWGKRKGEARSSEFYVQGIGGALLVDYPEEKDRILGPKVRKFRTRAMAEQELSAWGYPGQVIEWVTQYGEGKARELDAARRAAIWPDATDEELTAPGLEERLMARLPKLLEDFRRDIEAVGFEW